ncbi:hypothetical protein EB118_09820 [bacterium]|nr:hypothetical protein [bacterium]
MDAGAKRLQDLLDRQKKEREEKEKKDVAEGKWSNDDWGDMSKREFKRREMEHELGHEVEPRREKPKGMYFYTVPPMDLFKAKSLGLRQSRSGKWYSTRPNPQADKEFGPGKYWEPKSEGVAEAKEEKVPQKPRQGPLRPQTGAGKHKDKKKAQKQGQEKHKKPLAEAIMDSMLSELDKPSGKLYIVLKPDNTDNVRMVGAFANSPEEVEHIAARHGLKDKKGAKMKGLKIDLLFTDAADALMDLKRAFKDIDFVGAEQAEFVFKSSLFRNTEIDPRVAEEVREFKDYIESGDDPQMAKYQEKNVGDEPERKASGVDHFVIGPDGKRRRVAIPGKPNAQMGGHATEQPNVFRYILNRTELMPKLRDMGFKFDGNQIILNQKQRDMLMAKLGPQFQQIFGKKDTFKEATGDPVGKITKVDPATKKATISKPDGTSQEVDSTSLKTTADGKLAMDSPDQSQLTNKEVVSTEDALAPPNDSRSPIHGDEDHDEMSKLLVHRLRRLAGLEEQEPAASSVPPDLTVNGVLSDPEISPQDREAMKQLLVANPDGTVNIQGSLRNVSGELIRMLPQLTDIFKELLQDANAFVRTPEFAKLGPQDQTAVITMTKELPALIQKMDQQIMSMAQTHDQGFNKLDRQTGQYGDGQVEESDWTVPIGGLSQKQDLATGHTTTRYQAGPMDISQTKDAKGNVIGHDSSYRMGRDATIRAQRPVGSQITTMTGQANTPDAQADVDNILGVQGAADRKKVDPQKFAQFQRQMPKESAELEAMLRIAGLR